MFKGLVGKSPQQSNEPVVKKVSGSSPFPRQGFAMCSSEATKEIIVFSGMRDGVPLNDISVVSVSGLWSVNASLSVIGTPPTPRVYASAVLMNAKIFVYGGLCNSRKPDDAVYCYNLETKSWSQPRIQGQGDVTGRYGHGACPLGTKMFVFGGCGSDGFLNDIVVLDFTAGVIRWQIASTGAGHIDGQAPCPRSYHTLSAYESDKLIMFGGECSYDCMGDVWQFSSTKCTWSLLHAEETVSGPCARYHHSAVIYKNYLIVSGGQNFEGALLNDIWTFDLDSLKWSFVGTLGSKSQFEHQACLYKEKLVILGGGHLEANTVHVLDMSKVKFSSLTSGAPRSPSRKAMSQPSPPVTPVQAAESPKLSVRSSPPIKPQPQSQVKLAQLPVPPVPLASPPAVEDTHELRHQLALTQSQLQDAKVQLNKTQKQYDELQADLLLVDQTNRSNSKAFMDMEQQLADMKHNQDQEATALSSLKSSALVFSDVMPDLRSRLQSDNPSNVMANLAQALSQIHDMQLTATVSHSSEDFEHYLKAKDETMSKLKHQFAERMAIKADAVRQMEDKIASMQQQLQERTYENEQLKLQIAAFGKATLQTEVELLQANAKNDETADHNQKLQAGVEQSMQVVDALKASLDQTKAELKQTQEDKDMVAKQLAKNEVQFQERYEALTSQLQSKDDSLLLQKVQVLEQQLQQLQYEKQQLFLSCNQSVAQHEGIQYENDRLKAELSGITTNLYAIEESTQLIIAERDSLKAQVQDVVELEELRGQVRSQKEEIMSLKEQLQEQMVCSDIVSHIPQAPPYSSGSSIPILPPMPSSTIPLAPEMPQQQSSNIPPPPPPMPVSASVSNGSSGNNLLAEIQAKKLKKATEGVLDRGTAIKAPPKLDPVAQMMAEMQAKKLLKQKNAATN